MCTYGAAVRLSECCVEVSKVFVFTFPTVIQSLSSSESGFSVVHSGNHSTFSTALGWTDKQKKRQTKGENIRDEKKSHHDVYTTNRNRSELSEILRKKQLYDRH